MCLTINSYYHKSSDNCYGKGMTKYQPLKCDKDILVYKVLRVIEPYTDFEYRIRFNSGRYFMIQPSEPIYQTPFNYATIIFNEDGAARQSVDRFMTTADGIPMSLVVEFTRFIQKTMQSEWQRILNHQY